MVYILAHHKMENKKEITETTIVKSKDFLNKIGDACKIRLGIIEI